MEMADPELIASLLEATPKSRKGTTRRRAPANISFAPVRKVRRCQCGICSKCVENARWEKIFNEKFADPYYYSRRSYHFGSSLEWLRR
jgi:hypothetical protein